MTQLNQTKTPMVSPWIKDTKGNLVNLDLVGVIRTYKIDSTLYQVLGYHTGDSQHPFCVLAEVKSEVEAQVAMMQLSSHLNIVALELNTLN